MSDPVNFIDPFGLYESLPHYIVGREEAASAGMSRAMAEIVGRASGGVDTRHDPMKYENRACHFSDYYEAEARIDAARTPFELGEAVHALMDSFTHEGHNLAISGLMHLWQSGYLDAWDPTSERDNIMRGSVNLSIRRWMRAHPNCI